MIMAADPFEYRADDWDRVSAAFEVAMSLSPLERQAWLDTTYGGDTALRTELESLIAAHAGAHAFLHEFHAGVVDPALTRAVADTRPDDAAQTIGTLLPVRPGDRIRHFTVHERLGSGGAGVVYRGRDTLLDRDVAIKFLAPRLGGDPAARARLVREAQAASRLDDPNVCAIHAVENTDDGGLCIVMAFCAGGTLRDRLRRGPLPPASAAVIARHLARGLASAHAAGIVHGDIKPANVGFGDGDVARLLDFGVAVHAHEEVAGGPGLLSGTLPYLAPELWQGATRGPRTDVWALGVTFFEMVTGRRPFSGNDTGTIADAILTAPLPPLQYPDGSAPAAAFARLIRQMLSVMPEHRPADGSAVLAALTAMADAGSPDAAAAEGSPRAPTSDRLTPRPVVWRRRPALAAGAVGLALAAAVLARSSRDFATTPPAVEVVRTDTPLSTIAVLPFTTRGGRDIEYLGDGMVDLLTPAFDATGLVRGVDPNTVIGAVGDVRRTVLDSAEARAIATKVKADRFVVGSVVRSGTSLVFRATLRRIDGREVGRAQTTVEDSTALIAGVDALVRQLIATELLAPADTVAGIAAATTTSLQALRAYLDGERELRDARPAAAVANFQAAVAADSQFALAWYRLARAARWSEVDALSSSAAQRAFALAPSLPQRQQALVRAYHTLRFGSAQLAEQQFAQIVRDYPTDVEAWMLLGEAQFGSNPYYGRPMAESGTAFGRVMALDPRNREVTVYLMDLAAQTGRKGQLDTLFSMYFSPNSAGEQPGIRATYTALHRRRIGGVSAARVAADLRDDAALARVALHRVGADLRDRDAARAFAQILAAAPATRVEGLRALATLDVAAGDWTSASVRFRGIESLEPGTSAEDRALLALAPTVSIAADSLRVMRTVLQQRRPAPLSQAGGALTSSERDAVREYLIGLLSIRLDDSAVVAASIKALAARDASPSRLAASLASALTGHWQQQRGNFAASIAAFEQSVPDLPSRLRAQYPALGQHVDRLARAEVLLQLGRRREAAQWYRSLTEGPSVGGAPFVAAAEAGVRAAAGT